MRIGIQPFVNGVQPNQLQQLAHPRTCCLFTHPLVDKQGLVDLFFDCMQWIEGGHRLLKNHGDTVAAKFSHLLLRAANNLRAINLDGALRVPGKRIGQQLQDAEGGHGLARAAFPDEREGFPPFDIEGSAFDGRNVLSVRFEGHPEVIDFDKRHY